MNKIKAPHLVGIKNKIPSDFHGNEVRRVY